MSFRLETFTNVRPSISVQVLADKGRVRLGMIKQANIFKGQAGIVGKIERRVESLRRIAFSRSERRRLGRFRLR